MDSLLPGGNLGRYRVVELIGRGGMAAVFKAYDPERGRHVAIKVLPTYQADEAAFVERFRWEAQAVAQLNHPNIVQVYDFGEDKGFTYIVMEHLDGGTLLERMESRLPKDAVLAYIRPVAGALEYAHGRGIVHRDVKPGNILLDDEGKPILCDFGLARMLEESDAASGTGTVMGPPEYMAPEEALGRQPDHRTDIYALTVIVYQMLLGRAPFRAGTAAVISEVTPKKAGALIDNIATAKVVEVVEVMSEQKLVERLPEASPQKLHELPAQTLFDKMPAVSAEQLAGEVPPKPAEDLPPPVVSQVAPDLAVYSVPETRAASWVTLVGSPAPLEQILGKFTKDLTGVQINVTTLAGMPSDSPELPSDRLASSLFRIDIENAEPQDLATVHAVSTPSPPEETPATKLAPVPAEGEGIAGATRIAVALLLAAIALGLAWYFVLRRGRE